ncbi:MAG: SIR2 family protein, partial [Gammaproteobacteria bacterium]|nr:SIR2 family protein [Gammaproteobacteria bacterium]
MPWRDVFTTNWDTLLERARAIPAYAAVRAPSDLPSTARRRIVKLHGSLPNPPLILTEEAYRTYGGTHAPFVNTVQQAMMETVVLLLGFSGDDPNF